MTGGQDAVPAPRPGEFNDDGSPVDPRVCNPHHLVLEACRLLRSQGFAVSLSGAAASHDALHGAVLMISAMGLTPVVPGQGGPA